MQPNTYKPYLAIMHLHLLANMHLQTALAFTVGDTVKRFLYLQWVTTAKQGSRPMTLSSETRIAPTLRPALHCVWHCQAFFTYSGSWQSLAPAFTVYDTVKRSLLTVGHDSKTRILANMHLQRLAHPPFRRTWKSMNLSAKQCPAKRRPVSANPLTARRVESSPDLYTAQTLHTRHNEMQSTHVKPLTNYRYAYQAVQRLSDTHAYRDGAHPHKSTVKMEQREREVSDTCIQRWSTYTWHKHMHRWHLQDTCKHAQAYLATCTLNTTKCKARM